VNCGSRANSKHITQSPASGSGLQVNTLSSESPYTESPSKVFGKPLKKVVARPLDSGDLIPGAVPRKDGTTKNVSGLLSESQGQGLVLTVLHVPSSLDSGVDPTPQTVNPLQGSPVQDLHRALGIALLWGPRATNCLMSEVPL
jgi:hypothetical protein